MSKTPWLLPEFIDIWWYQLSQTLITSVIWLSLFVLFVICYNISSKKNGNFAYFVDMVVEWIIDFIDKNWWNIPNYAKVYIMFLFVYIAWNNIIWVVWDLFAGVYPDFHHIFRPTSTDVMFNFILAVVGVVSAIVYWFKKHWLSFLWKYIPIKWVWIVDKVTWIWTFLVKIIDIAIGLFVGFLEAIWEVARVLSLSLRLFGNIFAGMILVWLIIVAAKSLISLITVWYLNTPFILPVLILFVEVFVGLLQAFVFSLLVLVYFKIADTGH